MRTIENLRKGANPESEVRQLINAIHEEWKVRAANYAQQQEEKRRKERQNQEEKLRALEEELNSSRHENSRLRQTQNAQLMAIKRIMADHLIFSKLQGEKLIDLCGTFCYVLGTLIEQHEDVEVARTLQEEVNHEVAKILRQQSVELALLQDQEITEYLDTNLSSSNFPRLSGNSNLIDQEILNLRNTLHDIRSLISNLTPEYWDQESANTIATLKAKLNESTGTILEHLAVAEANHKNAVDQKFILQIGH